MDAAERHARAYGAGAAEYARVLDPWLAPMLALLVELGEVAAGDRVLDLACGTGAAARFAAAAGADVAAVDVSPGMVELARRTSPGVRVELADAAALPYRARSFDRVLCGFGLSHLPDPGAALAEVRRVLVAGGLLVACGWGAGGSSPLPPPGAGALGDVLDEATWADPERGAEVLRGAGLERIAVRTETFAGAHDDADAAIAWTLAWPGNGAALARLGPESQAGWLRAARAVDDLRWSFPVNYYTAASA